MIRDAVNSDTSDTSEIRGELTDGRSKGATSRITRWRARATSAVVHGWKTEVGRPEYMEGVDHSATVADVIANVPLRAGVRWTYRYSAEALLPPRAVTHTVALAQVVAPEAAVVRIATTGGPGFMPEWLLIDHGNVYVGTPDQASAWLHGQAARPTQTVPYAVLPPPSGHMGWFDGVGAFSLGPFAANSGVYHSPAYTPQLQGCSILSYWTYPGRMSDEVICPGIGWVLRSAGSICASERWTLVDFDPGPGADPGVRATAAWVLATATPVDEPH